MHCMHSATTPRSAAAAGIDDGFGANYSRAVGPGCKPNVTQSDSGIMLGPCPLQCCGGQIPGPVVHRRSAWRTRTVRVPGRWRTVLSFPSPVMRPPVCAPWGGKQRHPRLEVERPAKPLHHVVCWGQPVSRAASREEGTARCAADHEGTILPLNATAALPTASSLPGGIPHRNASNHPRKFPSLEDTRSHRAGFCGRGWRSSVAVPPDLSPAQLVRDTLSPVRSLQRDGAPSTLRGRCT